jgi:hypothetical protein
MYRRRWCALQKFDKVIGSADVSRDNLLFEVLRNHWTCEPLLTASNLLLLAAAATTNPASTS